MAVYSLDGVEEEGPPGISPEGEALYALRHRKLLTSQTPAATWLDAGQLYQLIRATGILVTPEKGYGGRGCVGGHVLEVRQRSGDSRVVFIGGGPEMSNDHHPQYEVVFRRSHDSLVVVRTRVTYWDFAGIEGFEWPVMHGWFACCAAVVLGAAWGVTEAVRGIRRMLNTAQRLAVRS